MVLIQVYEIELFESKELIRMQTNPIVGFRQISPNWPHDQRNYASHFLCDLIGDYDTHFASAS